MVVKRGEGITNYISVVVGKEFHEDSSWVSSERGLKNNDDDISHQSGYILNHHHVNGCQTLLTACDN